MRYVMRKFCQHLYYPKKSDEPDSCENIKSPRGAIKQNDSTPPKIWKCNLLNTAETLAIMVIPSIDYQQDAPMAHYGVHVQSTNKYFFAFEMIARL